MKRAFFILALALLVRADSLNEVLARMDAAAPKFRSMSTKFQETQYSEIFQETKVEEGSFKMRKDSKKGVVLLADFTGQDARKMRIDGNRNLVEFYHPKANSVDEYNTGKMIKSVDQFLMVGFGTTKAELSKTYNIGGGVSETIDGTKTTRIDLRPKSAEMQKLFTMIQLWIPDGQSNPIQEKVTTGKEGKDYYLFRFSSQQIQTSSDKQFPDSDFELNLPAGVKRIVVK